MKKYFRLTLLFLILAEIFSFCGFLYPVLNKICFGAILIITLALCLEKFEYGIYIMTAELFAGSFGYMFSYDLNGTAVSLRIGLFVIIMSVWLEKMANKKNREEALKRVKENKFIKYYFIFFALLLWGVIAGLLYGNGAANVFFDANGYIYFGLIFPLITEIRTFEHLKNIFSIFIGAVIIGALKTFFLLYVFSHKMYYAMEILYRWVRDYRFAEITGMKYGFYRVFSQSHIYALLLLFFSVLMMIYFSEKDSLKTLSGAILSDEGTKNPKFFSFNHGIIRSSRQSRLTPQDDAWMHSVKLFFFLYVLTLAMIIIGLSRSFWVGGFAAVLGMYYIFIFAQKYSIKKLLNITSALAAGVVLSLVLIFIVVKFPYPKEGGEFPADLLSERISELISEAGAKSRWDLLPVLAKAGTKHLFLGSGFGAAVTYTSSDPRIRSRNSSGEYTTYSFEWGYLDIILKIGLLGMAAYLWLIWKIFKEGWEIILSKRHSPSFEVSAGCLLGLIVILATSIFSPYMNHPLGIGYIMLCSVALPICGKAEDLSY